jgi:hypothetical protein
MSLNENTPARRVGIVGGVMGSGIAGIDSWRRGC